MESILILFPKHKQGLKHHTLPSRLHVTNPDLDSLYLVYTAAFTTQLGLFLSPVKPHRKIHGSCQGRLLVAMAHFLFSNNGEFVDFMIQMLERKKGSKKVPGIGEEYSFGCFCLLLLAYLAVWIYSYTYIYIHSLHT